MKRPAFQFYPADWRNNAKLRRCSWGARGVWIELMGLMHDSDEYGVLRWSLKEIAQALGAPMKLLRELVDCGVLYGCEKGMCEAMIYTPMSGRRPGEPVVLVAEQVGPIWYSPRMVRDEHVRGRTGGSTRFKPKDDPLPPGGKEKADTLPEVCESPSRKPDASPSPSPNQRKGEGLGDGSSTSSSSSSSSSVANATEEAADARRRRFEMFESWEPDEVTLRVHMRTAGLSLADLQPPLVAEFVGYWLTRPDADTHAGWCRRLVQQAIRVRAQVAAGGSRDSTATRGRAAGVSLVDNIADDTWADDAPVL